MDKTWWDREVKLTGCSETRNFSENRSPVPATALHPERFAFMPSNIVRKLN